jgi:Ran GTPase-activating protein (RanGAP) involved in mRNA processing and transport
MNALAEAIVTNQTQMIHVVSNNNGNGGDIVARPMEELYLGSASITSDGFSAISPMIFGNTSLRRLSLSDNHLVDQDIKHLSLALEHNKQIPLESLHLSFNHITCRGVEFLMNALWGSTTLRELKLDNNKINDRGAQLCGIILTSVELRILDLSFNKFSTVGIESLMKNLLNNSSVQSLALAGIRMNVTASKAVSYTLAYNTTLTSLHLDSCTNDYSSQRYIVAGTVSNCRSSLRKLTGFGISRKCCFSCHVLCQSKLLQEL